MAKEVTPNQMKLSASCDFEKAFDSNSKKPVVFLNRDISDSELKGLLAMEKKRNISVGAAGKVETRPQNAPLTNKHLIEAFHD